MYDIEVTLERDYVPFFSNLCIAIIFPYSLLTTSKKTAKLRAHSARPAPLSLQTSDSTLSTRGLGWRESSAGQRLAMLLLPLFLGKPIVGFRV